MSKRTCTIEGCGKRVRNKTRGLCNAHYQRWLRHGDPLAGGPQIYASPKEAFEARTEWRETCLIWTGSKDGHGYGNMRVDGKVVYVHRFAWEQAYGPIPEGVDIDHADHCSTVCVNVAHLRLATRAQNNANQAGAQRNNRSSGVRNVIRAGEGWKVQIRHQGKNYYFGTHSTIAEAEVVAERARNELFGEFAGKG